MPTTPRHSLIRCSTAILAVLAIGGIVGSVWVFSHPCAASSDDLRALLPPADGYVAVAAPRYGAPGSAPSALRRSSVVLNGVAAAAATANDGAAKAFAEFIYANQLLERTSFPKFHSEALGRLNANYPCVYGESLIGTPSVYGEGKHQFRDGWKWLCGLQRLQALKPADGCVIYSLGSAGMMDFEADLLSKLPSHCEVHIFDRDNEVDDNTSGNVAHQAFSAERAMAQFFPKASTRSRVHFHSMFIGEHDDLTAKPIVRSLSSIARELGHTRIDVLKCDIEGAEFGIFEQFGQMAKTLRVEQLLLEVHLCDGFKCRFKEKRKSVEELYALVAGVENAGLRLFHKEMNARYSPFCAELAFVQSTF